MEKKKLLLIHPGSPHAEFTDIRRISHIFGKKGTYLSNTLGTITALTPPLFEITIIDENLERIDFDKPYDLVGISGLLWHIPRAEKIAEQFKARGIFVVCGGPSVTLNTDKWRKFANCLIIGEAERTWPEFCQDFLKGNTKKEYIETIRPDLSISPIPDYSGYSKKTVKQYFVGMVQCSRGCPYSCEFCTSHIYLGNKMRYKTPEKIINEIDNLHKQGFQNIFLTDDNFSGGRKNAKAILSKIKDWNHKQKAPVFFFTQLSIDTANDDEFLCLAAEAGLGNVYVGIESPNRKCLKEAGKVQNLKLDLKNSIKKFHQYGIMVAGALIVGFDNDDITVFKKHFDFLMETGIPKVHINILQAREGSILSKRMIKEKRLIENSLYDFHNDSDSSLGNIRKDTSFTIFEAINIIPKQISINDLQQGTSWLLWNLNKLDNMQKRFNIFFKTFKESPYRKNLNFPKLKNQLSVLLRTIRHLILKSSFEEKKYFFRMMKTAKQSKLPGGPRYVLTQYFLAQSLRETLIAGNPDIATIKYPSSKIHEELINPG
ncbi:MAG: B12-binding domain-containing radical SAM protein [Desulfobacteraceae bacterium]|nr:B12-binding domain-containing radical SAM protein [Desulfobacteraceae bacterium]